MDLRQTISREISAGCVNVNFLKALRKQTDAAVLKALSGNPGAHRSGITELEAATLIALGTVPDPYGSCPREPKGEIGSRLLDLTFHVHRGLRYSNTFRPVRDPGRDQGAVAAVPRRRRQQLSGLAAGGRHGLPSACRPAMIGRRGTEGNRFTPWMRRPAVCNSLSAGPAAVRSSSA